MGNSAPSIVSNIELRTFFSCIASNELEYAQSQVSSSGQNLFACLLIWIWRLWKEDILVCQTEAVPNLVIVIPELCIILESEPITQAGAILNQVA